MDTKCPSCGGTGRLEIKRCPRALLNEAGWWSDFSNAFWALTQTHTWPEPGGLGNQSPTFVAAARLFQGWLDAQPKDEDEDGWRTMQSLQRSSG